jgi:hypothetical protein
LGFIEIVTDQGEKLSLQEIDVMSPISVRIPKEEFMQKQFTLAKLCREIQVLKNIFKISV